MEGESGDTGSIIDEFHSSDIQVDQVSGESGVTRRIIDDVLPSYIRGDQMESESGVTRSIIDEFILRISKDINWKVKVVLLEVSLMNFIL